MQDIQRIEAKILELGPWFHQIEIMPGVRTRDISPSEGPQPKNHPQSRWSVFREHIPADLKGKRILDIGCAEGFFTFEMARRGATVIAQDSSPKMIKRLEWAAASLGLSASVSARVGTVNDLPTDERYDFVLFLGLLYHLQHPFLGLERISKISDVIYLESAIDPGEKPYLYLKPPTPGVHTIPKWFPTASCVTSMLDYLGFDQIENLRDPTLNRISLIAGRSKKGQSG